MRRAEEQAVLARRNLERALESLENARNAPKEPKKGSVIKFEVQFHESETTYSYVALRAGNGLWYLTNQTGSMTWGEILILMGRDLTVKEARGGRVRFYLYGEGSKPGRWIGGPQ